MSRATYSARMRLSPEDAWMVEPPFNALAGHPYYEGPVAMAVFNQPGSGKAVYLEAMNIKPLATAQNAANMLYLQRCTAASGGELLSASKLDSAAADLPAEVEVRTFPASVTATGSTVRRQMMQSRWHPTVALAGLAARTCGDSNSGLDRSEFCATRGDADVACFTLNEGEGVVFTNNGGHSHMAYTASIQLHDVTNGLTYRFNDLIDPIGDSDGNILSILNGAGSGVVLQIKRIQFREVGSYEVPLGTWERIEALDEAAEEPSTLVAHDSAAPLPSGILVRANALAIKAGFKAGGLITLPMFHRAQLTEPPFGPGVTGLQLGRRGRFAKDMVNNDGDGYLVLREGEGAGLFMRNASALFVHEAQITFSVADVIPAAADVAEGVAYGFDQELEGTLAAGGGNTYSRGRVVNA